MENCGAGEGLSGNDSKLSLKFPNQRLGKCLSYFHKTLETEWFHIPSLYKKIKLGPERKSDLS